jgi:molybdate transport system ATP-binding protein
MSARLDVAIRARQAEFTLDVAWTAGEGVSVLFGPSGSGKTLTLQCLAGLVRPEAGRILAEGRILFDAERGIHVPPQDRRVGYVFQGYALFPHLTVAANIGFGLHRRPDRGCRTAEVIARLGLEGLENRLPRELSGGQRQRVALGRALAIEPSLVLLDEPLSALDLPLRRTLRDELGRILREWKVPAVLVTHDFSEAYQLGDQLVVYQGGRVLQSALRGDLLRRPASEAVARILGFRNVLHGTVHQAALDRIWISWRGHILEALNPSPSQMPPQATPVAFFIRPEDLRLIRKDGPPPDPAHHTNILTATVLRDADFGVSRTVFLGIDQPGEPAQQDYDLEIDVPRFVYDLLRLDTDRHWQFSIHRGSIHVLPT